MRFPVVGARCVKWFRDVIGQASHISKKFLSTGDKREKTCVTSSRLICLLLIGREIDVRFFSEPRSIAMQNLLTFKFRFLIPIGPENTIILLNVQA